MFTGMDGSSHIDRGCHVYGVWQAAEGEELPSHLPAKEACQATEGQLRWKAGREWILITLDFLELLTPVFIHTPPLCRHPFSTCLLVCELLLVKIYH